jgi:hypothetical protein
MIQWSGATPWNDGARVLFGAGRASASPAGLHQALSAAFHESTRVIVDPQSPLEDLKNSQITRSRYDCWLGG